MPSAARRAAAQSFEQLVTRHALKATASGIAALRAQSSWHVAVLHAAMHAAAFAHAGPHDWICAEHFSTAQRVQAASGGAPLSSSSSGAPPSRPGAGGGGVAS